MIKNMFANEANKGNDLPQPLQDLYINEWGADDKECDQRNQQLCGSDVECEREESRGTIGKGNEYDGSGWDICDRGTTHTIEVDGDIGIGDWWSGRDDGNVLHFEVSLHEGTIQLGWKEVCQSCKSRGTANWYLPNILNAVRYLNLR